MNIIFFLALPVGFGAAMAGATSLALAALTVGLVAALVGDR